MAFFLLLLHFFSCKYFGWFAVHLVVLCLALSFSRSYTVWPFVILTLLRFIICIKCICIHIYRRNCCSRCLLLCIYIIYVRSFVLVALFRRCFFLFLLLYYYFIVVIFRVYGVFCVPSACEWVVGQIETSYTLYGYAHIYYHCTQRSINTFYNKRSNVYQQSKSIWSWLFWMKRNVEQSNNEKKNQQQQTTYTHETNDDHK